ncbi:MAG: hypothetical protein M1834_002530 [Cirrosporium novae-zelandiae]|nr:MAG: hypothetical protein M1834_002530 [Cirrosporium novae-zelandiae]
MQNGTTSSDHVHKPTARARFRGSFAPKNRERQLPVYCQDPNAGAARKLYLYLTQGWFDPDIWKSAFVEAMGTMCLCYTSGLIGITTVNTGTKQVLAYVGVSNSVLLMLFIYATSPASGGHLNPLITFATLLTGLSEFPRAILYMLAQLLGSAISGGLIRESFGLETTVKYQGGGCYLTTSELSSGQAFVIEMMSSLTLLVLAFGVALDPRAVKNFGPLGPALVGLSLGLVTFAGSKAVANGGYPGPSVNPTRCFAFAVARGGTGFDSGCCVIVWKQRK